MTPLATVLVALISAGVPIILAVVTATWILSNKISDVRVGLGSEIGGVRVEVAKVTQAQVDDRADIEKLPCIRFGGTRPCRMPAQVGQ